MTDADIAEMKRMRKVGINIPKIFASFTQQTGGYGNVGFDKKKVYNEHAKERKTLNGDAKAAFSLLCGMGSLDPNVCWSHQVDEDGRLHNLFWCDGDSVVDYTLSLVIFWHLMQHMVVTCINVRL